MNKQLLYEYEELILGKRKIFSNSFFNSTQINSEANISEVLRFGFEIFLKWTPEEAFRYITPEIAKRMKFDVLFPYMNLPCEIDIEKDLFYLAYLAYPKRIKLNRADLVLKVYRGLLDGTVKKFPKGYLDGDEGTERATICFQYMIRQYFSFHTIQEMYQFFSGPKAISTLRKYKLYVIENLLYDSPIDYLHESLPESQRDDFLFHYYKFQYLNKNVVREMRKEEPEQE